jgi:tRNA-2-methylthio-N6-dimethylallyladenosine synthase
MLKLMNRGYTAQAYLDFIDRARAMMPDVSLASDFIVGFPTETEDDFAKTVELLKYCRFKNSFIFKYSPRPGTVAIDRFSDDVPEDVKRRRNNELLAAQQDVSAENNRQMIGKTVRLLVEGESKLASRSAYPSASPGGVELLWERKDSRVETPTRVQLVGRTRGDQVVVFDGDRSLKGELLDVTITDARQMTLFGQLVGAGIGAESGPSLHSGPGVAGG